MQKHEFALYFDQLSLLLADKHLGDNLRLINADLIHRITHVLRLQSTETIILFDSSIHARIRLSVLSKKHIEAILLNKSLNVVLKPSITVLLPILKRDAFEQAIYSCIELGANEIQLLEVQKAHRSFDEKKEVHRLHNIMVAAAEQSKQFALPVIRKPKNLVEILQELHSKLIVCCDINGQPLLKILQELQSKQIQEIVLLIGPEGDFTDEERSYMTDNNVQLCALTPTVLRAQQALVVALGVLRSVAQI